MKSTPSGIVTFSIFSRILSLFRGIWLRRRRNTRVRTGEIMRLLGMAVRAPLSLSEFKGTVSKYDSDYTRWESSLNIWTCEGTCLKNVESALASTSSHSLPTIESTFIVTSRSRLTFRFSFTRCEQHVYSWSSSRHSSLIWWNNFLYYLSNVFICS